MKKNNDLLITRVTLRKLRKLDMDRARNQDLLFKKRDAKLILLVVRVTKWKRRILRRRRKMNRNKLRSKRLTLRKSFKKLKDDRQIYHTPSF